ncbi:hypothetical protein V8G54_021684 [Vigna mungo]|uniref:Uncharacterized protein n=1 Tax=Vigna mungo TaxID=3915 RepID=A0AAQ3NGK5_VIGMU
MKTQDFLHQPFCQQATKCTSVRFYFGLKLFYIQKFRILVHFADFSLPCKRTWPWCTETNCCLCTWCTKKWGSVNWKIFYSTANDRSFYNDKGSGLQGVKKTHNPVTIT